MRSNAAQPGSKAFSGPVAMFKRGAGPSHSGTLGVRGIRFVVWSAFLVTALLPCSPAPAAVPALCADAPDQTAGTICAAGKLKAAERALAETYAALDARLDPLGKRNLARAEAAWRTFRDLECNLETGSDPDRLGREGTIMPMLLGECATVLTEQRTHDLAGQLKCPGGDLACEP